jgi:hypothetical protein
MRRRSLLLATVLALGATAVPAQTPPPFSMQPEAAETPSPPLASPPPQVTTPAAEPLAQPEAAETAEAIAGPATLQRRIVPFERLTLSGEVDERSWTVTLTDAQAAAEATLNLGYQNAVVVAPEASRLTVFVNGEAVVEEPVRSSNGVARVSMPIRAGLLQPGANLIRMRAEQRHRTDCTIESTFELWSEISDEQTFISFASAGAQRLDRLEDIAAVGVDANGTTAIRVLAPGANQADLGGPLFALVQGVTLLAGTPEPRVTVSATLAGAAGSGTLTVAIGTASELAPVLPRLPAEAAERAVVAFVDDASLGASVLVVSGPTWSDVAAAAAAVASRTERPVDVTRATLASTAWYAPDIRFLTGATRVSLADLGVATQEFTGRRFRTRFAVGVPADFYAGAYGEARLLLDAAYTAEILPGSTIDVYVNDQIAATVPITDSEGGIFRHFPVSVPLRHFQAGANIIELDASLLTEADALCLPGTTALPTPRFVLLDTSEFDLPAYARIAQRPNLSALAGTGFPYGRQAEPVPVVLGRYSAETYSAAATLLSRIALAASRPIPVELAPTTAAVGARNALFVGAASQLSAGLLPALGIADTMRTEWRDEPASADGGAAAGAVANNDQVLADWRDRLSDGGWRGQVSILQDWLERNFEVSQLSFGQRSDSIFEPPRGATFVIAQQANPTGSGTWTLVTAPSEEALVNGMRAIGAGPLWRALEGRIGVYNGQTGALSSVPAIEIALIETQPRSFGNLRLIAANWLSENVLAYSLLLVGLCVLLGAATSAFLGRIGRHR